MVFSHILFSEVDARALTPAEREFYASTLVDTYKSRDRIVKNLINHVRDTDALEKQRKSYEEIYKSKQKETAALVKSVGGKRANKKQVDKMLQQLETEEDDNNGIPTDLPASFQARIVKSRLLAQAARKRPRKVKDSSATSTQEVPATTTTKRTKKPTASEVCNKIAEKGSRSRNKTNKENIPSNNADTTSTAVSTSTTSTAAVPSNLTTPTSAASTSKDTSLPLAPQSTPSSTVLASTTHKKAAAPRKRVK